MYEADPFSARKAVQERQEKAAKRNEDASGSEIGAKPASHSPPDFANVPEAKMASSLRDLVEDAVKKASL